LIDHMAVLKENANTKLAEFSTMLTPGVKNVMGVKLPILRDLAKKIAKDDWRTFLDNNKEQYFEEYMLRSMVISYAKMDFDDRVHYIKGFVPMIDNWGVCDSFTYRAKRDERSEYWKLLKGYMKKESEFEVRFGVVASMNNFIDDEYIDELLKALDSIRHEAYYTRMGIAWNVATCLTKFPEKTYEYLKTDNLDDWTHNKAIQKTVESFRVTDEMKTEIRKLKRKK